MPINPSIPLQVNATQQMGPDWAGAMQGARTAWQVDAYRRDAQGLDATKKVFSDPASLDKDGNPTPEAMRQVMTASPEVGMKLRENVLLSQERQLRTEVLKSEAYQKKSALQNDVVLAATDAYEESQRAGDPPEVSQQKAQKALTEGMNGLRASGGFSPDEQRGWKSEFNYRDAKAHLMMDHNYRAWLAENRKHDEDARKDALAQRNADRLDQRLAEQGWKVFEDPTHPDEKGNPTPYRYNAGLAQYTDMDGKPLTWKPGGAQNPGTDRRESPAEKADKDQMLIADANIEQFKKDNGRDPTKAEAAEIRAKARIAPKVELAREKQDLAAISDDAAKLLAQQTMAGDYSGVTGIARNAASVKKVNDARAALAKERGISGADLAANHAQFMGVLAAERLLGSRGATIGLGIAEMEQFGPMVLEASEKIDRTRFPTVNALQLAAEQGTGGEEVIRLVDSLNALKNAYQQVLARGGLPTDDARRRSDEVIDKAWAKGQIRVAVDQLHKEAIGADSASVDVRAKLFSEITGRPKSEYPGLKNTLWTGSPQTPQQATPTDGDRAYLKANPDKKALFIKRFGQSEADKTLGQ